MKATKKMNVTMSNARVRTNVDHRLSLMAASVVVVDMLAHCEHDRNPLKEDDDRSAPVVDDSSHAMDSDHNLNHDVGRAYVTDGDDADDDDGNDVAGMSKHWYD